MKPKPKPKTPKKGQDAWEKNQKILKMIAGIGSSDKHLSENYKDSIYQGLKEKGVHITLATRLFKEGDISLGKAAKMAKMSIAEYGEYVSRLGIPVVNYSVEELEQELAYLNSTVPINKIEDSH